MSSDRRLRRHGAGDAEALLLTARKGEAARLQLVLDLVPEGGALEGVFDPRLDVAFEAVKLQAEGDIIENAHRKGIWLLEHHPDMAPHDDRIDAHARKCPGRGN